jgi:hypothetical protein
MRIIFESRGWAVREIQQDTDVGIDFEIEVFENFNWTGILFKVQLKSSAQTDYLDKNTVIREHVKRKHLAYYCKELSDPVILIHADVKTKRTFWLAPQLLHFPDAWLDGSDSGRRAGLTVLTQNELPFTINDLIRTIGQIKLVIGTRAVLEAPTPQFLKVIKDQVDENKLIANFREKSDALKLSQIQQLYRQHKFGEALARISKIENDPDCSVANRFWAILEKERIEHRVAAESGSTPQGALPDIHIRCARELQQLTKTGPTALKFSALILRKASELDQLTHQAVGLAMNYRNLVANHSPYWAFHAHIERLGLERKVWRKFNQCLRLARYATNSPHRYAVAHALSRIPQGISMYLLSLDLDNREEMANKIAALAFQVCELAAWIAERENDGDTITLVASGAVLLSSGNRGKYAEWAKRIVTRIGDAPLRADAIAMVERQIRRRNGEKIPGDLWKEPTAEQIYTNMAIGMGIKMADRNDALAQLVRIGISDADPTRVFKTCKYIFVSLASMQANERYLLERLGAPVGPKVIHCEKYRYGLSGKSLDEAYGEFAEKHCSGCKGRELRPEEWKYSSEWHDKESQRLNDLIAEFHVGQAHNNVT